MFGMGFTEILIIGVIAILFLGPDKLPTAMVEVAKFFRGTKRMIASAKESLDEELHITDIKEEALSYKKQLEESKEEMTRITSMNDLTAEINKIKDDAKVDMNAPEEESSSVAETESTTPVKPVEPEAVTFEKKPKETKPDEYA